VECFSNMALLVYNKESYINSTVTSGHMFITLEWNHRLTSEKEKLVKYGTNTCSQSKAYGKLINE
jgi:hypothetical protein